MRFRSTFLLLLLLAGLGAYVYWVERPKAEQEAKKKTLFELKADDVTEVTLTFPDREIALKKSGDEWRLTKPIETAADATTAKNLVSAIADCEVKKELTDASSDLSQYGLDKPFVTLNVQLKDRALPATLVGKNTPIGFSTYVQKADDKKILLTNAAFRSGLDKQAKDLRDKTIVNFTDDDVHGLEITADGKDIALVRKDGTWSIERPGAYPADATAVRSFLSTLRSMRAVDFPDDHPTDLSRYGLDAPQLRLRLLLGKDNAEKQILIGSKATDKKEPYVQTSGVPTVYTVSDWVLRDLNKTVTDFRDKTLLTFDRDKAGSLEVRRKDGGRFKLLRGDDKQWRADGVEGKPAATVISQYLGDVHDLKGYEIVTDEPGDLAQYGLDQPLLALTVVGDDGKPVGTVLIAERPSTEGKKEFAAMTEGGHTVFLVRDYLVTRLNKQPQDFVEKPTPTVNAGATPPAAALGGDQGAPVGDEPLGDEGGEDE